MKPYIILNCATSVDGKIALPNRQKLRLSNKEDFRRVHSLRSECDAIIVGIDTIIQDDPSLTINQKYSGGKNPVRIILDTKYRTPENSQILDNKSKTLIAIGEKTLDKKLENVEIILNKGIDVICAGLDQDSRGKPWETSSMLLGLSDKIVKIYGFCNVCGLEATKTFRKTSGGERTQVGAANIYEPRCLKHWEPQ